MGAATHTHSISPPPPSPSPPPPSRGVHHQHLLEPCTTSTNARVQTSPQYTFTHQQRCYSNYAAWVSSAVPALARRVYSLNASLAMRHTHVQTARSCSANVRQRPLFLGGGFGSTGTKSLLEAMALLGFVVWHASRSTGRTAMRPDAFRLPILRAWRTGAVCDEHLDEACYRVPGDVDVYIDNPSAEAFLDFWWANQVCSDNVRVILTRRRADDWVKSRSTFTGINAPVDRPCGIHLDRVTPHQAAQLFDLHAELIKCIVPAPQLLEMRIEVNHTRGLMSKLSWFARGRELPDDVPAEFPLGRECRGCYGA